MIAVNIRGDLKPLQRAFVALHAKQVPFATALALTSLAKGLAESESQLVVDTFDKATPFTQKAFRIESATKSKPLALVAAKDIQAQYLEPYVVGGDRSLGGKKAMLVPKNQATNEYGNLPKGALQRLKGKPNVFIGSIRFRKTGQTVSGVWQRAATRGQNHRGRLNVVDGARTSLKLLIRFEDTTPVSKNLDFYGRANRYLRQNAATEFNKAMKYALATAK